MSGVPSWIPVPTSVGSSAKPGAVEADAEPAAPARTSAGARPAFISIERVNPDDAVSVSICAMKPGLRTLAKADRWPFALGASCQLDWIERPPPRIAPTM